MTNLSHEIDTLRFVCGEIGSLSANIRRGIRGHPKEETAALLLNFECGALGAFLLSDATLDFPNLVLWQHTGQAADWNHQMTARPIDTQLNDAFEAQCTHFCRVISGREQPWITAPDATRSLAAVLAVFDAAERGVEVQL